ncbi:MAG: hypothetical protein HW406_549 [Candidatus Brocadiaceae bacterium]|nr:hypothetical protein [Candidatus Brocadiaceae bacterium]
MRWLNRRLGGLIQTKTFEQFTSLFNLKYIHKMNIIRVLLKDAIALKQHIEFLESGNIPEDLNQFLGGELCLN